MTNNDEMKQAFIDAGIKRHLHFTKLGYYKLYGDSRFLYGHYLQIIALIAFVLSIYYVCRFVSSQQPEFVTLIFNSLFWSTLSFSLSEILVRNYLSGLKILTLSAAVAYINFNFL